MTFKRRVLSALGKTNYRDRAWLRVRSCDPDGVDDIREVVANSKRVRLAAIVESLPGDTLKDVCVAVGLDRTQRGARTPAAPGWERGPRSPFGSMLRNLARSAENPWRRTAHK